MKNQTTDNKTTIEELEKSAVDSFKESAKAVSDILYTPRHDSENFRRHIISTEKPDSNSWFQEIFDKDITAKEPISKEILYKSNLYQMYDQTVEDFREYEGEIIIIEKIKRDRHILNASIVKKGMIQEYIIITDNDEHQNWSFNYYDILNMRYYPSTHTLTITLNNNY